jgi:hypothetical protein
MVQSRFMNLPRKIIVLIVILVLLIQVIQPTKNRAEGISNNDISKVYDLPVGVHEMLVKKCYDCHSHNTRYPWYFNVQPIGWWLAAHVHEGKEHLNFSEFGKYTAERKQNKFEDLREVVEDGSMPLSSYVTFHPGTEMTSADKQMINAWLDTVEKQD